MDGSGGAGPTSAAVGMGPTSSAAAGEEPRDARVVRELLRSMGLGEGEYEGRVVHQFLDLAYRYVADVLGDAQVYADHAGKAALDADDVRLAIQSKVNFSFSQPPPREVLLELARSRNKIPLPKAIAPPGSIPLPPDQDTLLSPNYQLQLFIPKKQPSQAEETEEDDDSSNPNPNPNPNPNHSQELRGNDQQQPPQHTPQRVSFQLNAVAAAAAKRPRMTMEQGPIG